MNSNIALVDFSGLSPRAQQNIKSILQLCENHGATVQYHVDVDVDLDLNEMTSPVIQTEPMEPVEPVVTTIHDEESQLEDYEETNLRFNNRLPIINNTADIVHVEDLPPLIVQNSPVILLDQMLSLKTRPVRIKIKNLLIQAKNTIQSDGRTGAIIEAISIFSIFSILLIFC